MRPSDGGERAGGSRSEAPSPDGEQGGKRDTLVKTLERAHSLADVVGTSVPWKPVATGFGHGDGYGWVDLESPPLPPPSLSVDQYSAVAPNRAWGDGGQLDVAAFGDIEQQLQEEEAAVERLSSELEATRRRCAIAEEGLGELQAVAEVAAAAGAVAGEEMKAEEGESGPISHRKPISRMSRKGRDPEYYKLAHEPFVLPASVEAQFKVMCAAGNFDGKRVDELIRSKPWGELSQVSAEDGLKVLSNLSKINLSHVENLPGYLIGVMKNLGLVGKLEINKPWHQRGHGGKGGKGGGKGRTGRRGSEMLRMAVKNHTMMVNNNNVMNYNNNAVMYLMEEAERGGRGGQGASHRYPHYPPPVSHQQQYPHYPPLVPLMDPMSHQRQFGGYPSPPTSPYMYGAGQQSFPVPTPPTSPYMYGAGQQSFPVPSPPTSPYMYGAGQQSVPVYMPYSS